MCVSLDISQSLALIYVLALRKGSASILCEPYLQLVFLSVHDDGGDLLVEEDENGRQQGGDDCKRDQPNMCYLERIDQPASIVSCRLKACTTIRCYPLVTGRSTLVQLDTHTSTHRRTQTHMNKYAHARAHTHTLTHTNVESLF